MLNYIVHWHLHRLLLATIHSLENIRVLIGKNKMSTDVYWEFGSPQMANRHLLITGTSGQGKTYSIQTMLYTRC